MSPLTCLLSPFNGVPNIAKRCPHSICLSVVHVQAYMDDIKETRRQLSLTKFEARFDALIKQYPKAERWMAVIYHDRKRWAEYVPPLAFSVGSWATSRVEGAFTSVLSVHCPRGFSKDPCTTSSLVVTGVCVSCVYGFFGYQAHRAYFCFHGPVRNKCCMLRTMFGVTYINPFLPCMVCPSFRWASFWVCIADPQPSSPQPHHASPLPDS